MSCSTLTFTATATDSDIPTDTLTFTLDAASLAAGMSIDANTGIFTWTPSETDGGTTPSVTVTVTDSGTGNLVDSETFTITVNDVNVAPVFDPIGNQSVDELATLTFTATASDSDLPSDTLTFSLDAASIAAGMTIDAVTGDFSWTPTESDGGSVPSVTVTVTDSGTGNLIDSETFTITVNDTNTAPVLDPIGNQTIDELSTLTFTATASDSDLPSDTLTFSLDAASLAAGMTIDSATGVFTWTPSETDGGTTPSVTVTVTDSGTGNLVDSETFIVTVGDIDTTIFEPEDIPYNDVTQEEDPYTPQISTYIPLDVLQDETTQEEIDFVPSQYEPDKLKEEANLIDNSLDNINLETLEYVLNSTETPKTTPEGLKTLEPIAVNSLLFNSITDSIESEAFRADIDKMYQDIDEAFEEEKRKNEFTVEAATGISISLTAGFVAWLFRSGSLIASLFATMPVWRNFDPVIILSESEEEEKEKLDAEKLEKSEAESKQTENAEALFDKEK